MAPTTSGVTQTQRVTITNQPNRTRGLVLAIIAAFLLMLLLITPWHLLADLARWVKHVMIRNDWRIHTSHWRGWTQLMRLIGLAATIVAIVALALWIYYRESIGERRRRLLRIAVGMLVLSFGAIMLPFVQSGPAKASVNQASPAGLNLGDGQVAVGKNQSCPTDYAKEVKVVGDWKICQLTAPNTTQKPDLSGYNLHYYSNDPGVPGGYYGPACVPNGDPNVCKQDLLDRIKHDPMLCSVWLRNFNLLPGAPPHPVQMPGEPVQAYDLRVSAYNQQVEAIRKDYQARLEKSAELRKECADNVSPFFRAMSDFHIEALSGTYFTEYTDSSHNVTQTTKVMNPAKNFAIVGTTPDGVKHMDKIDCGHQTVSPTPIPGVPPQMPPSSPPNSPPGKHRTPKCEGKPVPTICGTPDSGPDFQPPQDNKQGGTAGYLGNQEGNEANQPVGSPDPSKPIPNNGVGYNSGSTSGGPRGGDTSTGEVQQSIAGQSGGTQGSNTQTNVSGQPAANGDTGGF